MRNTPPRTRRAALLLGFGGALSGCGFRPVHGPAGTGPGPAAELGAIEVKPIYERPGQLLREALMARLRIEPGQPRRYDLQVSYTITGEAVGQLNFSQVTRVRATGRAHWDLRARDGKQTKLASGDERIVDGFDLFAAQYFAIDLDNEAMQRRIANQLAEKVVLHLAVWFQQHPSAAG
ncbi:MAG: hypothetical protein EXR07_02435 [Acetobacteraceae bacterium]|nr:hypothetical protein [Acetobacteraceae bacterium]